MPKAINELKKYENLEEIKEAIVQILKTNHDKAYLLNELEFILMKEYDLGINLGGKLFVYYILRDLINLNKIQSIISKGKEYFFI